LTLRPIVPLQRSPVWRFVRLVPWSLSRSVQKLESLVMFPRLPVVFTLLLLLLSLSPAHADSPAPLSYWHTEGSRIVDDSGQTIRIAGVNWFGMENKFYVPAGLDKQPLSAIVNRIRALGFNTIRLPFSDQLVEDNPTVTKHLAANPELKGLHALDLMDRIVNAAGAVGLRVILNNARSSVGTAPDWTGLWYTRKYPQSAWIKDWQLLATRYAGNPIVVGVDLRNEPHTSPPGPWSLKAYLGHGATWGAYAGHSNPATDWRTAAERAGNAVLAINPHLLVFVEGVQLYPDPKQPRGVDTYWWAGVLQGARQYPVRFTVPHQLVYSPHEYGPVKARMSFFGRGMTYQSMVRIWNQHWGYLLQGKLATPIFIGEFGTCGDSSRCVSSSAAGSQGLWFRFLVRYLHAHPQIGWAFWALNGTNHLGKTCSNCILRPNWKSVRLPALIKTFNTVETAQ
jgi:endoglucanase